MSEKEPVIVKVSGPLVVAENMHSSQMYEVVRVGEEGLVGEIIRLEEGNASIQVYEETAGIGPGEPVKPTGQTLSVELGPGLLQTIYDGIQRPLKILEEKSGMFLARGIQADGLDHEKKWDFVPTVSKGDTVSEGDILGTVQETSLIEHKVMVQVGIQNAKIESIEKGKFTVLETIATLKEGDKKHEVTMRQYWPIRTPRKVKKKIIPETPLKTGCRSIDMFFPLAKGGAGCIPGPFGSGKTVTQQSLAKFCDAQVIVYIGCGERGNEMTEVLNEFPHLIDPNTGEPLMRRTVMIANTSNMPVAAREASVYTGITIAEFYRDMGYNVALMADSTSRWAEAMREISGRLEEMPGEEGYPAYLGSKTAEFYERAGSVQCLGGDDREGTLTVVGAVSPPGGDLSEPVSQNTLRVTKTFWGLDSKLAYQRHFPAINWLKSYSLYLPNLDKYMRENIAADYWDVRNLAMSLLQQESKLEEIVKLVGPDALSTREKLILLVSKSIREDYLYQDSFSDTDAYTSAEKQYQMLKTILSVYHEGLKLVDREDFDFSKIEGLPVIEKIAKVKTLELKDGDTSPFENLREEVAKEISAL
ncbi:V-type ATP synthase subunit A [Candidatus Gracilibacteria bacterium]|nr:V-type ATP synthase subunit A [Candidatus Gracilibacteria bacterium]MCF7819265.1 V-type ATP synthase subunit A [Candidatus Gracilibacteria bacterium]